jgi:TolB-like protein
MTLFAELKRRNVFRVAAAYLVTGWLLIEIGNTLEETLHLPDWADTLLAFFLIIGFVPTLFFTWAYEITPDGIKKERDIEVADATRSSTARKLNQLIVVVMALALVYFALDKWVFNGEPAPLVETQTETAQAAPAYFSDGISEELLNLLVKIDGLRVPSRTSSFAFKGQNTDIKDIARQLDVGHILEGSVRKAGNRVRVTAQLIDVATDTQLWSETYDRELEDIFAIQDEISGNIVRELQLVLGTRRADQKPTENLEAYNLYLRGLYLFQQRGDGLLEAERFLMEATDLDPEFAEAWGLLALVRVTAPGYLGTSVKASEQSVLEAAQRAQGLVPKQPHALLAQAQLAEGREGWAEALDLFHEVTDSHPNIALARLWYGVSLLSAGYLSEALDQLRESVRLDPLAPTNIDWLARALVLNGYPDEAVATAQRALALGRSQAMLPIHLSALVTGRFDEVRQAIIPEFVMGYGYFENIYRVIENPELYDDAVAWAERESTGAWPPRMIRYARLAFALAAQKPEDTYRALHDVLGFDRTIIVQLWVPQGRWLLHHPVGRQFIEDVHLDSLWERRGWPDRCRRADEGGFECD